MSDGGFISLKSIVSNADYLSNWITGVAVAGGFSALISFKDKLTGAAIMLSFCASTLMALAGWPVLLRYGYGGLGETLVFAMICGIAGMTILLTFISMIRRVYERAPKIADHILTKGGLPEEEK